MAQSATKNKAALIATLQTSITVRIDQDDVVWMDDDSLPSGQHVAIRLRTSREESGLTRLRIATSPNATHGRLLEVMDAGVSAGMTEVQLSLDESQ